MAPVTCILSKLIYVLIMKEKRRALNRVLRFLSGLFQVDILNQRRG